MKLNQLSYTLLWIIFSISMVTILLGTAFALLLIYDTYGFTFDPYGLIAKFLIFDTVLLFTSVFIIISASPDTTVISESKGEVCQI